MTDPIYKTIDQLPAGTPNTTDNLEVSQGGVSRRVTLAQIGAAAGPLPFLPLAGGTLTGPLVGTTATFSGEISAANPALGDNDSTVATTKWVKDQAYAGAAGFLPIGGGTLTGPLAGTTAAFTGNVTFPTQAPGTNNTTGATTSFVTAAVAASPAGSVTTVSVSSANGFAGTVANPTSAPAITLSTSVTGVLKGNGTAISAAVANSDYLPTTNPTFNGTMTGGAYAGTTATLSAAPAYPNNTTSVATTAFVTAGIAAVSGGGPFLPTAGGTLSGALTGTTATWSGAEKVMSATAIPAGGTAGSGYLFSSTANFGTIFGSGAPTASAARGSLYLRSDGSPYLNLNGTTSWGQVALLSDVTATQGSQVTASGLTVTPTSGSDQVMIFSGIIDGNVGTPYNVANGRYTPPLGSYFMQVCATWGAPAGSNGTWALKIRKNGTVLTSISGSGSLGFNIPLTLGMYLTANGTDFFDFVGNATIAGMTNQGGNLTAFKVG